MKLTALLIAIGSGLFFLIGFLISKITKNKNKLFTFAIALAFVVMLGLIVIDLVPELIENLENQKLTYKLIITTLSIAIGIVTLKILDNLVPDHHHDHHDHNDNHKEHASNMYHIGLVTSIALILHNIIEGSAIYITSLLDVKSGLLIALGVGLHNIPLGIEIGTTMDLSKKSKIKKLLPLLLMVLSTGIGALIIFILKISFSPLLLSILIGITIGMLIYITIIELLKEVIKAIKDKATIFGIICGIIIIMISLLM